MSLDISLMLTWCAVIGDWEGVDSRLGGGDTGEVGVVFCGMGGVCGPV